MSDKLRSMVQKFQCPGCVGGACPNDCSRYNLQAITGGGSRCASHVAGTFSFQIGHLLLGMPKGFNRLGIGELDGEGKVIGKGFADIVLFPNGAQPRYDKFNVPVWAMIGTGEEEGYLFVRVYQPRINRPNIHVIEGGTLELVPNAINVAEFFDDID